MKTVAYIALGSNIGNGAAQLRATIRALQDRAGQVLARSSLWRSAPVGMAPDSDWFTNAVVVIETTLSADRLLAEMQGVEGMLGRPVDHGMNLPRTVDLDLILFNRQRTVSTDLTLPHPRALDRLFVLLPLSEVAPGLCWPGTESTIEEMIDRAPGLAIEKLPPALWCDEEAT
jgi:2-amino-4-hydroxy-6-hydroxymethyldihydropteridine diphosphokinase